jgi:ribosomal protein S18 acetylase RimI-like enzyme
MIQLVTNDNLYQAAVIHSAAWKQSHSSFCTPEFVSIHTPERQMGYLNSVLEKGAKLYMLVVSEKPVGIVSVLGGVIENLYVLPEEQGKGYGTQLLQFAVERCEGHAKLWVLNNNLGARRLYERIGFAATGEVKRLSETLAEIEMCL